MKYKKLIPVIILVTFTVSYLLPQYAFCITEDEEKLRKGIKHVDVLYDSKKATGEFKAVIKSRNSSLKLKVKAYFWLAYTRLFEGDVEETQSTFAEMFKAVSNPRYNFTKGLSASLIKNEELMNLYEAEKKKAYEEKLSLQKTGKPPAKFESSKRIISEGKEMFRDLAIEEFKKAIKSEESSMELKVSAYFWLAYAYLLEKEGNESYTVFKSMLENFKKPDYDYTAHLDKEISSNNKLMGIFQQAKDVYVKSIEEKKIRTKKRNKVQKSFTKKLVPVLLAIGYVAVIGMAIDK